MWNARPLTLVEILEGHRKIAQEIVLSVRALPLFEKYLEYGLGNKIPLWLFGFLY